MSITYFVLLLIYAIFSYGLTAPNLILINQDWFTQFQTWMWQTFFNNRTLTVRVYLLLISLLFINYFLLHKKIKSKPKTLLNYLLIISPLILAFNALSYDVFNYIFNAKMVLVYQANPHVLTALDFKRDDWIRFMHNIHTPAPYWYGWTTLSLLPYLIGFNKFLPSWLSFKFFSLVSLILLFLSLKFLIKKIGQKLNWSKLALLFLNPLLLIEILSNAHNDLWMLVPAILSLALILKINKKTKLQWWQPFLSLVLLGVSVSIKLATLALSPVWIWLLIRYFYLNLKLPKLIKKLDQILIKNFGTLVSGLMFLPLLTARSQQFHPWYLSWCLVWLPLIKNKIWKNTLLLFSISSLLRYLPWLAKNDYTPQVLLKQKLITWVIPVSYLLLGLIVQQIRPHHSHIEKNQQP